MLITLIDVASGTNNEFARRTDRARGGRTCVRSRCETAEISWESLARLWYLNYGHFYTLLVWHVSTNFGGWWYGHVAEAFVRAHSSFRNLHSRRAARDRRRSSRLTRGVRLKKKIDDGCDQCAADNGGKYDERVKKRWSITPDYLSKYSHRFIMCVYLINGSNKSFKIRLLVHSLTLHLINWWRYYLLCFIISSRKLINLMYKQPYVI